MAIRNLVLLSLLATTSPAMAGVVDLRPNGFTVKQEADVAATPAQMFERFGHPETWWSAEHTWWGKAENLSLALNAGGCWCERKPDGTGEAEHLRVIFVEQNQLVRLSGLLGPLSQNAATGILTARFKPEGSGTKVTLTYDVEGHLALPSEQLAPLVDQVLGQQFGRLIGPNG